jgi:hypothetical protein
MAIPRDSYVPLQVTEQVSGRQVTVYNLDRALRGKFDTLLDNEPALDSTYNGVDVTFTKRLANRWMLMGGVSLGRNIGDIYAETADLNNPNFTFRRGVVGNDVPVSFKASGVYQLPYSGITLSASVQHSTGFPENTTVLVTGSTVPLTQVSQSLVVEPRGTIRLPSTTVADLSVRRPFKIGGSVFEPVVDIYNLANSNTIQGRPTQLGPSYHRVANILRGRLVKLGFNVKF